jgi:hypothetical protein
MIFDYDLKRGTQHNVEPIILLSHLLEMSWGAKNPLEHWAKVFSFDAVIGNTDRHQDNWGVVWEGISPNKLRAIFSPAFDNGTSLGHEIMEDRLHRFTDLDRIDQYIGRGTHHARWKIDDPQRRQHFELLKLFRDKFPFVEPAMRSALAFEIPKLESEVAELTKFQIPVPLSLERAAFVLQLIKRRRDLAVAALDGV